VLREAVKSEKNAVNPYLYPATAEKLTEQLLSYNPDIIICGNTEWLLYTFLTNAGIKDLFPEGNGRVDIKNNDRLANINNEVKYSTHSSRLDYNLYTPVPIDISYEVTIISKYQEHIDRAISNFIPFFNKDLYVRC
jgi:hypothetical protein